MATRTVTGTVYDENGAAWAEQSVIFNLQTDFATTSAETVLNKTYTLTTDENGDFTAALAVPDSDAWKYQCSLPDKSSFIFNLEAGGATTLRAILADLNLSATVSASDLSSYIHYSEVLDENDMASDSATLVASQQSIKAYVDSSAGTGTVDTSGTPVANDFARFTAAATIEGRSYAETRASLNIEDGADVTDVTNVAAAGALMTSGGTMSGDIAMADGNINRAVLKDYGEDTETDATSTATKTLDIAAEGNVFDITLTAACTFTFSNPSASGTACSFTLILRQDGTGSRTVTWPSSVDWNDATAPTLTTTATTGVDVITFLTVDAGTVWFGFTAGQAMG